MTRSKKRSIALAAAALMGTGIASAQSVQPMRFDLRPSGAEAQTTMQIENNRTHPITVEIVPDEISLDERGAEVLTSAEDDFLIFPPQAIIEPGRTQSVRVRYIGDAGLEASKSYRVTVKQIPVDLSGQQRSGVSMAFNFATLGAVVPVGAKPNLSVAPLTSGESGKAVATISNDGDAYARILAYDWTLRDGEREHVLSSDEVTSMMTGVSGLVPPSADRRFTLTLPEGFDASRTTLALTPQ